MNPQNILFRLEVFTVLKPLQDLFNHVPLMLFQLLVSKETSQTRTALEGFAVQTLPGGRGQSLWLPTLSVVLRSL